MQHTFAVLLLPLFINTINAYLTPTPPGKSNVTLITGPLADYTRKDPQTNGPRTLMLSIFQPSRCISAVPVSYMPNRTAEYQGPYLDAVFNFSINLSPLFLDAQLPVCPNQNDKCKDDEEYPILLFSPGWGIPRLYYSVLASAIASEGFTVITIDHPEDANIITYPDGHAVYNNVTNWTSEIFIHDQQVRAKDVSFIIDQLSNATAMAQLGHRPFSTKHIAMFGHSLGGVASIIAAGQDSRIRAAMNWDGTIFGSLPPKGVSQPVLFMGEANIDPNNTPSWAKAWPQLHGPKLWVNVANSTHETFSDVPTLFKAAGVDASAFAGLLGTIKPARMVQILAAYTAAWMKNAFEGNEGGPLLEHDEFPEVSTVLKGNF